MPDSTFRRIPENVVTGKRLGRHVHVSAEHMAAHPAPAAAALVSVKHQTAGLPLNQGETSSCTGNALAGCLNTSPHWQPGNPTLTEQDALTVYSAEEQALGYGPYPPNDNGGSGQAVCEAAERLGWLSGFSHATDVVHAMLALVKSPVITGVNWYDSFDQTDTQGRVRIAAGATVRGGHEIVATELIVPLGVTADNARENLDRIWVGLEQSWGKSYGLDGRFYWTAATWARLLAEEGDVTVPATPPGWVAKPGTYQTFPAPTRTPSGLDSSLIDRVLAWFKHFRKD